jgi:hypothetical protein
MSWLLERFKEPSTYLALFAVGSTFFGIDFTPEQQQSLSQLAIVLLGGGLMVSKG